MTAPFLSASWYRVAAFRPRLREHAELHRHLYRGRPWYVLQDDAAGRSHKLTPAAYRFVALMDGERSVDAIWTRLVDELGDGAPAQDEVIRLLSKLHGMDLLRGDCPPDAFELSGRSRKQSRSTLLRMLLNPLSVRVPLWNPDRFLDATAPLVTWLFGWGGAVLWLAFVLPALVLAAAYWSELSTNVSDHVFATQNLVAIALIYPVAKLIHELGHGYAIKAFGGSVPELGTMLLVFFPSPYVDASAASGFRSRAQRITVGAAGILAEAVLAAAALYLWLAVEPGLVRALAYNLMLIAGFSTLVFNANPLLRYDGYYILADLIEIPNLGQRAARYWGYLVERYVFRAALPEAPRDGLGERAWFLVYAPSAFLYRLFVSLSIALFVAGQYFFVGVVLGVWSVISGFVVPCAKTLAQVVRSPNLQRRRARAVAVTSLGLAAGTALMCFAPVPLTTTTEGVIWLPDDAAVRAGADGFVDRLVAEPGRQVRRGERLVATSEPLRAAEIAVLRARRDELELRLAAERFSERVQAEVTRVELDQVKAELAREEIRQARLSIASPAEGRFVVLRPSDLPGRYLREGEVIGYVTPATSPLVRVSVRQDDVDLVRKHLVRTEVRLAGHPADGQPASVLREIPSGHDELPSKALSNQGGGPFGTDPRDTKGLKTLQRVFQFDLALPQDAPASDFGSRVHVRFTHDPEPLAFQLFRRGRQLLLSRLHA